MADDDAGPDGRGTAPQTPFGAREVRLGLLVLVVGLAITVGIPVLYTL